ncbi:hypothetical protein GCM10009550_59720 [Actinocorallia libanotica]|uniref:Heme chaperone HemW n=1 Tax=Actinocorallia libanotica TaxID=46162 RepID=A0ABN1RTU0_9ACTN
MKPYQGYVYAYPHKTAYRPLDPAPALRDVWRDEDVSRLFLYLHIPFCEIRCGFCNLFTRTGAPESLTTAYLDALERQAEATLDALGPTARFTQAAFGGGTPTYLTAPELTRLCELATRLLTPHPTPPSTPTGNEPRPPSAMTPATRSSAGSARSAVEAAPTASSVVAASGSQRPSGSVTAAPLSAGSARSAEGAAVTASSVVAASGSQSPGGSATAGSLLEEEARAAAGTAQITPSVVEGGWQRESGSATAALLPEGEAQAAAGVAQAVPSAVGSGSQGSSGSAAAVSLSAVSARAVVEVVQAAPCAADGSVEVLSVTQGLPTTQGVPAVSGVPLAVETSPGTATRDRLEVLKRYGTERVSIGVQSFVEAEARAAVRPQRTEEVVGALDTIRDVGFPVLNIDLIYGIDGQTAESWLRSIDRALEWQPEELYLYPLYVRPLTGLGRIGGDWDDQRLRLYRLGRDHLLSKGYEQVSMRMFRLPGSRAGTGEYSCQEDGMVGLGCGARSYTANLHYSFEYAVHATEVRAIIDDYVRTEDFTRALVGFPMTGDERRRRHLLQSLLQAEGLDRHAYRARFGTDVLADIDLTPFARRGWLEETPDTLALTPEGLAHSDAIGPALFSPHVHTLMNTYRAR